MSQVKIMGESAVLTSTLKREEIELLQKLSPNQLVFLDEDTKDPIFAIGIAKVGSISENGVLFNNHNNDGFATATILLPDGIEIEKRAEWVSEHFEKGINGLNEVEERIHDSAELAKSTHQTFLDGIEILD